MPRPIDRHGETRPDGRSVRALLPFVLAALVLGAVSAAPGQQAGIMGDKAPPRPQDRPASTAPTARIRTQPVAPQIRPPGPERFAVPPKTPLEFWDAADYLVRTGQAAAAVPYLNAFLRAKPDDATLIQIRDTYGIGSILRLQDDPSTKGLAQPILDRVAEATRRVANQPNRVAEAIAQLNRSPEERQIGIERLRQAGAFAVAPLLRAIAQPGRSPEEQARLVESLSHLDDRSVAPLLAALDAPDAELAAHAADALGRHKDRRAVPGLTFPAARPDAPPALRDAARRAIARITGKPFEAQPKSPSRLLTDLAWQYHRGQVPFPAPQVDLWTWRGDGPKPATVDRREAASELGKTLARQALQLDPSNVAAQKALTSLSLEQAARRLGPDDVAAQDPDGVFLAALATGPGALGDLLHTAIADGHGPLAEVAAKALGRVTPRDVMGFSGRPDPLVEALAAPDRRVQYAAAEALVALDPPYTFPGSNRVVPVLARFLNAQQAPRALVIDGNVTRASQVAGALRTLGYDAQVASNGRQGFTDAAESADTELILLDPTALPGSWGWLDTLTNLRADARTAGIPVLITGPRKLDDLLRPSFDRFPRTGFLVTVSDPRLLRSALDRELPRLGARPLSVAERKKYAEGAAALLAKIARPGSPFANDLAAAEPALSLALNNPAARLSASAALGDVPDVDAQRSLADALIDRAKPPELRRSAATQLVRSIQRFGPLLTGSEERRLADGLATEPDPALRGEIATVIDALRPLPGSGGARMRGLPPLYQPAPAVPSAPAPSATAPEPTRN